MTKRVYPSLLSSFCALLLAATPVCAENTGDAVGDDDSEAGVFDPAGGYDDLRNRDSSNHRDSDGYYVDGGGKRAKPVIPQGDWGYGRTPPSSYDRDGSGNTDYVRFETSDPRFNTILNHAFNNPGACITRMERDYVVDYLSANPQLCGGIDRHQPAAGRNCTINVPICR